MSEQAQAPKTQARKPKTIKVKALSNGFFRGSIVETGTVFEIDSKEQLGSWMEEIK